MRQFILTVLVSLGLMTSFEVLSTKKILGLWYETIIDKPYLLLFAFVGIFIFLKIVDKLQQKTSILQKMVSLLFAISTWFTEIYSADIKSVNTVIVKNPSGVISSMLFVVSFFIVLESLQKVLTYFYYSEYNFTSEYPVIKKLTQLFEKHPFLFPFLTFSVIWLIIAITAYPSVFMGDSIDQIEQVLGMQTRKAAHPVLSTLFIGSLVKLGILLGDAAVGLFIYTVLQVVFVAACLAYAIFIIHQLTKQTQLLLFSTFLLGLIPSVNSSVVLATKDIVFSGLFVVFMATLAAYFYDQGYYEKHHLYVVNGLSVMFMLLFRYNTLHFIVLTMLVYLVGGLVLKRKIYRVKSLLPMMILGLLCGSLANNFLVGQFAEAQPKPKRREMLSLPFQHTARFLQYHEKEVTQEDCEIINAVLEYDIIKEEYNPIKSDAVKRTHDETASSTEMKRYFQLVGRQVIAHPLLAVESVMASHGNLFNLNQSMNWYYDTSLVLDGLDARQLASYDNIGLKDNPRTLKFNERRHKLYGLVDKLPLLSQLNNYATYIFIMLSVFVLWLRDRKFLLAAIVIPMGAFMGTLIAGPITHGYIRYLLPLILFSPLLFVLAIDTKNRKGRS